jgi:hypothetical protein
MASEFDPKTESGQILVVLIGLLICLMLATFIAVNLVFDISEIDAQATQTMRADGATATYGAEIFHAQLTQMAQPTEQP